VCGRGRRSDRDRAGAWRTGVGLPGTTGAEERYEKPGPYGRSRPRPSGTRWRPRTGAGRLDVSVWRCAAAARRPRRRVPRERSGAGQPRSVCPRASRAPTARHRGNTRIRRGILHPDTRLPAARPRSSRRAADARAGAARTAGGLRAVDRPGQAPGLPAHVAGRAGDRTRAPRPDRGRAPGGRPQGCDRVSAANIGPMARSPQWLIARARRSGRRAGRDAGAVAPAGGRCRRQPTRVAQPAQGFPWQFAGLSFKVNVRFGLA
jgi:hypothetical protein